METELETDVEDTDNELSTPAIARSNSKSIFEKSINKLRHRKSQLAQNKEKKMNREIEIESGVEVMEEMLLSTEKDMNDSFLEIDSLKSVQKNEKLDIPTASSNEENSNVDNVQYNPDHLKSKPSQIANLNKLSLCNDNFLKDNSRQIAILVLNLIIVWFLMRAEVIKPFYQGFIICFVIFISGHILYDLLANRIINKINVLTASVITNTNGENGGIQRGKFKIPSYDSMPILEIPAVEEFKQHKIYTVSRFFPII